MGKVVEFPEGPHAVVEVVVVVVVDVETATGEAPNNPKRSCADAHL